MIILVWTQGALSTAQADLGLILSLSARRSTTSGRRSTTSD
jgi:hypothetical protein